VVIHIEDASVAGRTVVASFGLKDMADQAVSSSFVVWVVQEKSLQTLNKLHGRRFLTQKRGTLPGSLMIVWKNENRNMKVPTCMRTM
jgi:hypothetical protein